MENKIICFECGAKDTYDLRDTTRAYKGEGYHFELTVTVPFCKVCGAPIYEEQIESEIARKANEKIRQQCGSITRDEILEILKIYNVSQKFLSRLLGWGEITLTRYIGGNYTPNAANSCKLKELRNPYVFQQLLQNFRNGQPGESDEKLIRKAQAACSREINKVMETHGKIFGVVNWFLSQASEEVPITHLALQKLLYFVQGWSRTLLGKPLFDEDCQAGTCGVVYSSVYDVFKQFKAAPLPGVEESSKFEEQEERILGAVKSYYFDRYSTKALEEICRHEEPFIGARNGGTERGTGYTAVDMNRIYAYYSRISQKYNICLHDLSNVKKYLNTVLD